MASSATSQYSVTVWPGGLIESEPLLRWPNARLLPGGWIEPGLDAEYAPAPEEAYLRLARDTDLSDPHALLQVVQTVGGMPIGPARDCADYNYKAAWRRLAAFRDLPYPDPARRPEMAFWHVAEVAWRLRVLDVCGRLVVAYRAGDYVSPVWAAEQNLTSPEEWAMSGRPSEEMERKAWDEWLRYIRPALRRWHVRPVVSIGGAPLFDEGAPTLLEVGALQIMNDLAREADYHVCANETCGRTFARQVGGGEVFSRRTGVRYCSTGCKNAQAQREHRRRARARKERGAEQ